MLLKNRGPHVNIVGKWNGIGGKCEPHEMPWTAMVREFKEEAGVFLSKENWARFCEFVASDFTIDFFAARTNMVFDVRTMESEEVRVIPTNQLWGLALVNNLRWMIPWLLDRDVNPDDRQFAFLGQFPFADQVRSAG